MNSQETRENWLSLPKDFKTKKIVALLENNRQTTIKKHFYKYSRQAREKVKVVIVDMSGAYILLIRKLFPKAEIVLDRFHIVQHLSRAMMSTRIAIMKTFDKKSLPYRAMKNHWRILRRKLSDKAFYSRTFRQTLTPREFAKVFKTFLNYQTYVTNAMKLPYSNAKLEATNKLIKDIKRQAFGFRNFKNFKTKILITLNMQKERTNLVLSRT